MSSPSSDANAPTREEEEEQVDEQEEQEGIVIEIDPELAAAIADINETLASDSIDPQPVLLTSSSSSSSASSSSSSSSSSASSSSAPSLPPTLEALLLASDAPVKVVHDPAKGRKVIARRKIAEGEIILAEEAIAVALVKGKETVLSMKDSRTGRLVCTLPLWASVRTFRDSFTLSPRFRGHAEEAFGILSQLTALGENPPHGSAWADMPAVPPGIDGPEEEGKEKEASGAAGGGEEEEESEEVAAEREAERQYREANVVPRRAQLLHAIAQTNGFIVRLPEEDSDWKRAILWPMVGRLQLPSDRERLFDEADAAPLTHLTGLFPLTSCFNHDCEPNCTYAGGSTWKEGEAFPVLALRAKRDIEEGEELSYSYLPAEDEGGEAGEGEDEEEPDPDADEASASASAAAAAAAGGGSAASSSSSLARTASRRRYKLLVTYRFLCSCQKCCREVPGLADGKEKDPLARHFPFGMGVAGIKQFYKLGGTYPPER